MCLRRWGLAQSGRAWATQEEFQGGGGDWDRQREMSKTDGGVRRLHPGPVYFMADETLLWKNSASSAAWVKQETLNVQPRFFTSALYIRLPSGKDDTDFFSLPQLLLV